MKQSTPDCPCACPEPLDDIMARIRALTKATRKRLSQPRKGVE